jgi:hypothetical protein
MRTIQKDIDRNDELKSQNQDSDKKIKGWFYETNFMTSFIFIEFRNGK